MTFNVQYHFRCTFCGREKLVRLETGDARDGEKRIRLRYCHYIVWNGIDPKLALIKVLHHIRIAKLGEVSDAVDVIGKVRPIFQAKPVSPGRNTLPRHGRLIQVRVLILNVKGFYPRLTVLVLPIINNGIEADGGSATAKVIESEASLDVIRNRKHHLSQKRWSP